MDRIDVLLTIAEVAVAFAGFASLASLIGRESSSADPRVDAVRLRNMLSSSMSVVALSLVPVLVLPVAPSEALGWIVSSAIALVWATISMVRGFRRARPIRDAPGYDFAGHRNTQVLGVLLIGGLLINSTGVPGSYSDDIYLGTLLLALAMSGMLFARVVASVLGGDAAP